MHNRENWTSSLVTLYLLRGCHNCSLLHIFTNHEPQIAGKIINPVTGCSETIDSCLACPDSHIWIKTLANKIGRCSIGLSKSRKAHDTRVDNNIIFFIKPSQLPPTQTLTYHNFVYTLCLNKSEIHRIRMTVDGDQLDTYQDVRFPAVGTFDAKTYLNSVISDARKGACYCIADINEFPNVIICRYISTSYLK